MLNIKSVFTGISVDNLDKAKDFYSQTLGLELEDDKMGLNFNLPGGGQFFIYPKEDHQPATYTVLNLVVENIEEAVEELSNRGAELERYEGLHQDEKGIARGKQANMGSDIAWFKDPAGNILSVLET